MKIKFPFEYITTNHFGKVYRPYATIEVFTKDLKIWVKRTLIIDSGADFTIFPRKDAFLFGIDLKKETTEDETFGVGGKEKIYLYKGLAVKIRDTELKIPVGFLNRNDIPALLGRQKFLEKFKVCFIGHITVFEK